VEPDLRISALRSGERTDFAAKSIQTTGHARTFKVFSSMGLISMSSRSERTKFLHSRKNASLSSRIARMPVASHTAKFERILVTVTATDTGTVHSH
jgi:hypothetical protein